MSSARKSMSKINSIDGLLWDGWHWDTTTISYFFPIFESQYPTKADGFGTLNVLQRAAAELAFHEIAGFTNFSFVKGTSNGQINLAKATKVDTNNDGIADYLVDTAVGFPPSDNFVANATAGDIWFNPTKYNNPLAGSFQFASGIIHEVGHSMGLKHPHEIVGQAPKLESGSESMDGLAFTIMSYSDYPGDDPNDLQSALSTNHPQSYMMLDIAALQYLYGANFTSNGNTIYRWTPTIELGVRDKFFREWG